MGQVVWIFLSLRRKNHSLVCPNVICDMKNNVFVPHGFHREFEVPLLLKEASFTAAEMEMNIGDALSGQLSLSRVPIFRATHVCVRLIKQMTTVSPFCKTPLESQRPLYLFPPSFRVLLGLM